MKNAISPLIPHSSSWFEEFMLWDTGQAMHTMAIIAAAGGDTAICGICGDKPASDYYICQPEDWWGWRVRRCDDCHQIRSEPPYSEVMMKVPDEPKTDPRR